MDIRAYAYIKQYKLNCRDKVLCFSCTIKEVLKIGNKNDNFVLTLEQGDTGYGNDTRGVPQCEICHEMMDDFNIG